MLSANGQFDRFGVPNKTDYLWWTCFNGIVGSRQQCKFRPARLEPGRDDCPANPSESPTANYSSN
jgi:hypothetical protein